MIDPASELEKKATVLRLARRLWAAHGYHAISLRQVANAAQVALSLVDRHFGKKEALFAQAIDELRLASRAACLSLRSQVANGDVADTRILATALAMPIEALALQGGSGRETLRLWLRHSHDSSPELKVSLEQCLSPLKGELVHSMSLRCPAASRASLSTAVGIAFSAGVQALLDLANENADGPVDARTFEVVTRYVEAALGVGMHEGWRRDQSPA